MTASVLLLAGMLLTHPLPPETRLPGATSQPAVLDDAPAVETDYKQVSPNHRFFFQAHLKENRTDIFQTSKPGIPYWTIPRYFSYAVISNDGRYLADLTAKSNILENSVKATDPLITFYSPGKPAYVLTVGWVVGDVSKLPYSTSGRPWGIMGEFDDHDRLWVQLQDRRVLHLDPAPPPWP